MSDFKQCRTSFHSRRGRNEHSSELSQPARQPFYDSLRFADVVFRHVGGELVECPDRSRLIKQRVNAVSQRQNSVSGSTSNRSSECCRAIKYSFLRGAFDLVERQDFLLRPRSHGFGLIGGKFSKLDHFVNDCVRRDFPLLMIHGGEAFAVPDDLADRTQSAE